MPTDIAELLSRAGQADPQAADELFASLYTELRRLPERQLERGGGSLTLGTTTLVHDAYLSMMGRRDDILLSGVKFTPRIVDEVTEFMKALTDPAARNLGHLVPMRVPSGLPIDGPRQGAQN